MQKYLFNWDQSRMIAFILEHHDDESRWDNWPEQTVPTYANKRGKNWICSEHVVFREEGETSSDAEAEG